MKDSLCQTSKSNCLFLLCLFFYFCKLNRKEDELFFFYMKNKNTLEKEEIADKPWRDNLRGHIDHNRKNQSWTSIIFCWACVHDNKVGLWIMKQSIQFKSTDVATVVGFCWCHCKNNKWSYKPLQILITFKRIHYKF